MVEQYCVELDRFFNNFGVQPPGTSGEHFGFNIWKNTFPAEDLPPSGGNVTCSQVTFRFPARGDGGDNIRCRGQEVRLPAGRWDWIYTIGAAERRTEDDVTLHFADGITGLSNLRMSDFWPETPAWFDEPLAFRTQGLRYPTHTQRPHSAALWVQRIPIPRSGNLLSILLPDNPAMHIFAMTAIRDQEMSHV